MEFMGYMDGLKTVFSVSEVPSTVSGNIAGGGGGTEQNRAAPDRFGEWVCFAQDKFDVPANVVEALHGPESKLWKAAMEEEMASMNINNVWSLVECPKNKKPIRCKWIFKKKTGPDGNVCSYKARLVAQGYAQKFGADYDETFSPVTKNEVFLEQSAYTKALLSRFGMDNGNSVATPVDVNADLVTTSDEVEECDKDLYQSAVDADWAGDRSDRKSTSGYCFTLSNSVITWRSVKQSCVALSTAEAEYVALAGAAQEAIWLKQLLDDLEIKTGGLMVVNEDNQSAICLAQNPKYHGRNIDESAMEDDQDGEWRTTKNSRKRKEKPVEESEIQEGGKKKMHTSADGAEGSEKEKPYDNLCPSGVNRNQSFDRADASTSAQSNCLREKGEKGRVSKLKLGFNITKTMRSEDSKVILVRPIGMEAHTFTSDPVALAQGIGESPFKVIQKSHIKAATVVEWYAARFLYRVSACAERLRAGSKPGNEYELFLVSRRELALIAVNSNSPLRCLVCSGPHTKDECTAEPGQEKCANCHQTHIASSKECPAIRNAAAIQKLQRSGVGFEAAKHRVMKTQTELATKAPFMKKQNLTVPTVSSNIMGSLHSIQENQQENQKELTIQEVMVDIHQSGGSYLWSDAEALPSTASSSLLYSSVVQGLVDLPSTSKHFQLKGVQKRIPSMNITQLAKKPSPQMTTATECAEILSKSVASLGKKLKHQMKEMGREIGSRVIQRVSLELKNKMESVITEVSHTILSKVSSLLSELILANMQKEQPPQHKLLLAGRALEEMLDTFPVGIINNDSPTYIDKRVGTTSTLDLFFATHNLVRTSEVRTGPDLGIDHFPVCCTLGVVPVRHPMGAAQHWKLGAADWTKWTSHLNSHTDQTHVGLCNAIMGNNFLLGTINVECLNVPH
ncbi:Reverse transcriptase RNA-dependent DNA polymerase [Trinorchestia longiramus]|nr:Reverse transcriptase RNA-dependent DNA polymerase [Trinorchestia longiramus]